MYHNNTDVIDCQEVLSDVSRSGRKRPWAIYKLQNTYLAYAYDDIDINKSHRLRDCATWLEFVRGDDGLKLHNANFCRVRLCPICAWRRSLKTYSQVSAVVDAMHDKYSFIFLTLTLQNCRPDDLSDTITHLINSFNLFIKYKSVKQAFKGVFRALEITHNIENNTYHPHLHCLVAVNNSYFSSRYYLSQDNITKLWQKSLHVGYTPVVHVERIYGKGAKAIAEVAKYSTKSSEVICFDDWDLTVDTVRTLDAALNNRRLIGWYGVFRDYHKMLHLDDSDDGDLVHTETDIVSSEDDLDTIAYTWHSGYNQYIRS